ERLVGFDQVQFANAPAGTLQRLAAGGDRPGAHDRRVDTGGGETGDARQWLQTTRGGFVGAHHHQRGGAVVDATRIAGRDDTVLDEGRAQLRHALGGGVVADVFVAVHH